MTKLKNMFHYGKFEKRIIIVTLMHIIFPIIWICIEQYLTYSLIDDAIKDQNIKLVINISLLMLSYIIIQRICGIVECLIRHHLQRDFSDYVRKDIFKKIITSKIEYIDKSNTGELFELVMNDSDSFATFFTQNGSVSIESFSSVMAYLIIVSFIDIKLTLIIGLFYLIAYISVIISNKKTFILMHKIRELNIDITKWANEQIDGIEVIKSLGVEKQRLIKMKNLLNQYTLESSDVDRKIRNYNIIYDIFSLLTIVIVTYLGGLNVVEGILSYGSLVIFINSTKSINESCNMLIEHFRRLNQSYISALKILEFNEKHKPEKNNGQAKLTKIKQVELKNINFSYDGEKKILEDINLKVNENEKVAIIGRTGAGKTTLVNLLCRFYDLKDGEILINGENYEKYDIKSLREQIGYVLQEVVIFDGNVYENINYADKKVKKEEIEEICKKLNLHRKIVSWEKGYETNLNDNKDLLSQGEKQMINFARILLENPSMIILDEVTSSLSYENEELIKNAINQIMKGRICFVIAHRLSTIKNCDKIVSISNGKIISEEYKIS